MFFSSNYVPMFFGKKTYTFSKEKGLWLLANVEQEVGWPTKRVMLIYRNRKVLLLPANKTFYPAVAIISKDDDLKEGKTFLMHFLSAMSWACRGKINIFRWTNSAVQEKLTQHIRLPFIKRSGLICHSFGPIDFPNPDIKSKAQLALALFREGLSLNHRGYSVLSLYKVINLKYKNPEKQKKWIRNNIPNLEKIRHLKDKLITLKKQHEDLADYIYRSCRCAVAHASIGSDPVYDPENVEDEIRFYEIWPIVSALAKLMIENKFGIKTSQTIYKEHLYELEGFHLLLDKKIATGLKQGKTFPLSDIQFNTKVSLRLWSKRKFKAFEKLKVSVVNVRNGVVELKLSRNGIVTIPLQLDFPNEKLNFDPMINVDICDDGSQNAASQIADYCRFYGEIFANGILEVWDSLTNRILGRLSGYLPVNINGGKVREDLIKLEEQWRITSKNREQSKVF